MKHKNIYFSLSTKYFSLLIFLFSSVFISAQNCQNYGTKCDLTDNSYTKGSISQGLKIINGQMISAVSVFYEGKENYISVCGEFDVGLIQFQILNFETKQVLYDNTNDYYKQNINIRVDVTAKVIIQLSAPNVKYFTQAKCIGLLIAYLNPKN